MSKLKYYDGTNWKVVNGQITGDTLPIGSQIPYGSTTPPSNWLVCDGSAVSRTIYAELFAVIGTSYGAGDGSTTFNLPNKKGRNSVGYDSNDTDFNAIGKKGGSKELQEHSHNLIVAYNTGGAQYGATVVGGTSKASLAGYVAQAGNGNSGNLSPYEVDCWIIKAKQSAGVVANVSNTYSTSETDTYSCDYINNTIAELKPYVLFAGSTTGTVTLNDSAANYTFLEIYYQGADNFNSTKIYNPNGKSAYIITGWMGNNTTGNVKFSRVSISGTTISKINYTSLNYDSNYANASEENGISITTVIGYK